MAREFTLVYTDGGTRSHLLDGLLSPNQSNAALCGRMPSWPNHLWLGTGSQDEYERAETMRSCSLCLRKLNELEAESDRR